MIMLLKNYEENLTLKIQHNYDGSENGSIL